MTKYELSIAPSYVPDWGTSEAVREIFQNALDNESTNPENTMSYSYDPATETLKVANKTSVLSPESLLLGISTKRNEENTIGKHGEGYKLAFMVLAREGKKITVYNYGSREVWEARLVNSRKYNGQRVLTVFSEKKAFWEKTPNDSLTIEIAGISTSEYTEIMKKNLNIRTNTFSFFEMQDKGRILLDKNERGNIYVKGLFVDKLDDFEYGYDFKPDVIKLDRDRRLVDSFDVAWEASRLWKYAASTDEAMSDIFADLYEKKKRDTMCVQQVGIDESSKKMCNKIAERFIEKYGEDAVPVSNNQQYDDVKELTDKTPVIVDENTRQIINSSDLVEPVDTEELRESLHDMFQAFLDKIEDRLEDDEIEEFQNLIDKIHD
jgi:hypothetical protein